MTWIKHKPTSTLILRLRHVNFTLHSHFFVLSIFWGSKHAYSSAQTHIYIPTHTVQNHLTFSWKFLTLLYHCFCKYCLCEKCIRVMKFPAEALISSHFYNRGWIREYNLLLSHCSSLVLTIEILLLVFLRQTWPQPDMTLLFFQLCNNSQTRCFLSWIIPFWELFVLLSVR